MEIWWRSENTQVEAALGPAAFEAFADACTRALLGETLAKCPGCSLEFVVEPPAAGSAELGRDGAADSVDKRTGKRIAGVELEHYNTHRARCPACATSFCSGGGEFDGKFDWT